MKLREIILFAIGVLLTWVGIDYANAADLPSKKTPVFFAAPQPMIQSWTGFYVGANIGVGVGGSDAAWSASPVLTAVPAPVRVRNVVANQAAINAARAFNANNTNAAALMSGQRHSAMWGLLGGAQLGYDYQVAPQWVVGVAADLDGSTLASSGSGVHRSLSWLGSARVRGGYLVMPQLLLYGTGGLAFGELETLHTGWVVGAGAEYRITPQWSVFGEARFYDLGASNWKASSATVLQRGSSANTFWTGIIGANYRFNLAQFGL